MQRYFLGIALLVTNVLAIGALLVFRSMLQLGRPS